MYTIAILWPATARTSTTSIARIASARPVCPVARISTLRRRAVHSSHSGQTANMTTHGFKVTDWVDPKDKTGEFKRQVSAFRDWIGRPNAESGVVEFPAEAGRYHLYVSYACPWATRTLIARKLKGLEDVVSMSSVHWHLADGGWRFATAEEGDANGGDAAGVAVVPDPAPGHEAFTHLREVYAETAPAYQGRVTVPVLFDKTQRRVVNNESSEILRMFNTAFDDLLDARHRAVDLYPAALRDQIEAAHVWQYDQINNGVYKSGFATTQTAYDGNVRTLFAALDRAEQHLAAQAAQGQGPYWFGATMTEVDVRLFVTIIRFDPVYVQHFKCNLADIRSGYPHLHKWMRHLYWNDAAYKDSTNFLHIKNHYTKSHTQINPFSITPLGPLPDVLALDEEVPAVKAYGKV